MITPIHKWPELRARAIVPKDIMRLAIKESGRSINALYHAPMGGRDVAQQTNEAAWDRLQSMAQCDDTAVMILNVCKSMKARLAMIDVGITADAAMALISMVDTMGQCVALLHSVNHHRHESDPSNSYIEVTTVIETFMKGFPLAGEVQRYLSTFPHGMGEFDAMTDTTNWPRGDA